MGLGVFAYAVGVNRTLNTDVGAVLLPIFGFGMIVAGVFVPDAVRGYPPGAPSDTSAKPTWQALVHAIVGGPVAFLALFGACPDCRWPPPRRLAALYGAHRSRWPRYDDLDCHCFPDERSEDRTHTARPHLRLLELDRAAGHPPHNQSRPDPDSRGWTSTSP